MVSSAPTVGFSVKVRSVRAYIMRMKVIDAAMKVIDAAMKVVSTFLKIPYCGWICVI